MPKGRKTKRAKNRLCHRCALANDRHEITRDLTGRMEIDGRLVTDEREALSRPVVCGECGEKVHAWYEFVDAAPKVKKVYPVREIIIFTSLITAGALVFVGLAIGLFWFLFWTQGKLF